MQCDPLFPIDSLNNNDNCSHINSSITNLNNTIKYEREKRRNIKRKYQSIKKDYTRLEIYEPSSTIIQLWLTCALIM